MILSSMYSITTTAKSEKTRTAPYFLLENYFTNILYYLLSFNIFWVCSYWVYFKVPLSQNFIDNISILLGFKTSLNLTVFI